MQTVFLNCTSKFECTTLTENYNLQIIVFYMIMVTSSIGVFNNIFIYNIFSNFKNLNTPYFRHLNTLVLNSFFVCLNDFFLAIFFFASNQKVYILNKAIYSPNYLSVIENAFISTSLWMLLYSTGAFLDIFLIYNRVLLFLPNWKFLKNTSVYKYENNLNLIKFFKDLFYKTI